MFLRKTIAALCAVAICGVALAHVKLEGPMEGDFFKPGEKIVIRWTESVDHGESDWDLYYSSDGGSSWEVIVLDLLKSQNEYSWDLPFTETTTANIRVVQDNKEDLDYTDDSGNFIISFNPVPEEPGTITTLKQGDENLQSDSWFMIYPNPANTHAIFQLTLNEPGMVALDIYDLHGRLLHLGKSSMLSEGTHLIPWETGERVSGIFIGQVTLGDMKIRKKFLVKH